jgi:hypothetical protein
MNLGLRYKCPFFFIIIIILICFHPLIYSSLPLQFGPSHIPSSFGLLSKIFLATHLWYIPIIYLAVIKF